MAAALSKAGYKVAQLDTNSFYGGNEASLSFDELIQWADANSSSLDSPFSSITYSTKVLPQSRQYSICLRPSIIPSMGPLISSLISSGVSKYSGFRLLDCVSVYHPSGIVKNVPASKEDVFKNNEITLIGKRRLMRFLTFAAGDFESQKEIQGQHDKPFLEFLKTAFSLSDDIAGVIAYALAFCVSEADPTLPALRRLHKYLHSIGRYGPSAFLVGHYGGIGDIAQGFCRAAAVHGATYILGRRIESITHSESGDTPNSRYTVRLVDFPEPLQCNLLISSPSYVPPELANDAFHLPSTQSSFSVDVIARCTVIINKSISFGSRSKDDASISDEVAARTGVDTGVLVVPPSSVAGGSSTSSAIVFITGEGSMSAPSGKWILYIALPVPSSSVPPESILKPYLHAILALTTEPADAPAQPLFTMFYLETSSSTRSERGARRTEASYLVPPCLNYVSLAELSDTATVHAEATFREALKVLGTSNDEEEFWPPVEDDQSDDCQEK